MGAIVADIDENNIVTLFPAGSSSSVVRRHYIRLEEEGTKVDAMARLEQAYEQCAAPVQ